MAGELDWDAILEEFEDDLPFTASFNEYVLGQVDFDPHALRERRGVPEFDADLEKGSQDAPIVKLINLILIDAMLKNASRISFECDPAGTVVRYQIDGADRDIMRPPPPIVPDMIRRLQMIAGLDPFVRTHAQAGPARLSVGRGRIFEYRVMVAPTRAGGRAVIDVLSERELPPLHVEEEQRSFELEAAILAGKEEAWQIYADWLLERGDPRGELINLMLFERDASDVLEQHQARFFGPFAGRTDLLRARWSKGFIEHAQLRVPIIENQDAGPSLLRALLDLGSARFLRSLELDVARDPQLYGSLLETLAEKRPPHLRSLAIGDGGYAAAAYADAGSLAGLNNLDQLRALKICAVSAMLSGFDPSRLESLAIVTAAPENVLAPEPWPALLGLELDYLEEADFSTAGELFTLAVFPKLERLHLRRRAVELEQLVRSTPLGERLRISTDLSQRSR